MLLKIFNNNNLKFLLCVPERVLNCIKKVPYNLQLYVFALEHKPNVRKQQRASDIGHDHSPQLLLLNTDPDQGF